MSNHPPRDYVKAALYDARFLAGVLKDATWALLKPRRVRWRP